MLSFAEERHAPGPKGPILVAPENAGAEAPAYLKTWLLAGLLIFAGLSGAMSAQMGDMNAPPPRLKQMISYATEEQVVKAGKRSVVEMRFRVIDGYHVNSHRPLSDLLIPTTLKLDAANGVKVEAAQYPAGTSFSLEAGSKLDVYSGTFVVRIPVVAAAGTHTLKGVLHYQACDNLSCLPPRNLPVQLLLTAK